MIELNGPIGDSEQLESKSGNKLLTLVGFWILGTVLGSEFLNQELSCRHASCVVCVHQFPKPGTPENSYLR